LRGDQKSFVLQHNKKNKSVRERPSSNALACELRCSVSSCRARIEVIQKWHLHSATPTILKYSRCVLFSHKPQRHPSHATASKRAVGAYRTCRSVGGRGAAGCGLHTSWRGRLYQHPHCPTECSIDADSHTLSIPNPGCIRQSPTRRPLAASRYSSSRSPQAQHAPSAMHTNPSRPSPQQPAPTHHQPHHRCRPRPTKRARGRASAAAAGSWMRSSGMGAT